MRYVVFSSLSSLSFTSLTLTHTPHHKHSSVISDQQHIVDARYSGGIDTVHQDDFTNVVELNQLAYTSSTTTTSSNSSINSSRSLLNTNKKKKKKNTIRNNAILTINNGDDDDDDDDDGSDDSGSNNDSMPLTSSIDGLRTTIANTLSSGNGGGRGLGISTSGTSNVKYQQLSKIDPTLRNDSDDDDSLGRRSPFYRRSSAATRRRRSAVSQSIPQSIGSSLKAATHFVRYTLMADVNVAMRYVHNSSKKNVKSIVMGLITVLLVVTFISFLQNLIQNSPVVFLKLSEDQAGELDLVLTGDPTSFTTTNSTLQATHGLTAPTPSPLDALSKFSLSPFLINSTMLTQKLSNADMVHGVAPRWTTIGDIQSPVTNITSSLIMLVINSTLEKQLGLGRGWNLPPLIGNQAHFSSAFLRRLQVEPNKNQTVNMHVDFVDVMERMGAVDSIPTLAYIEAMISNITGGPIMNQINIGPIVTILSFSDPNIVQQLKELLGDGISSDGKTLYPYVVIQNTYGMIRQQLIIDRQLVVVDGIDSPGGKYPSSLGNVAVLESAFVNEVLRDRFMEIYQKTSQNLTFIESLLKVVVPIAYPQINVTQLINQINVMQSNLKTFATNFNLNEYSMTPVVMLQNRVKIYTSSDDDLKKSMIAFTNQVAMYIGYNYQALYTTPLSSALYMFRYTRLSLDQIFNCVAAVLLVLGALMIYSLLLSDVEGKTFEYGMLRAQGMRHYSLIILLLTQALYFSIPGILFGLLFGWVCFAIVAHFVYQFAILPVNLTYYTVAVLSGALMGFCLPILANIAPIQRALSRTLRDALDVYHQVKNETMVKIMKLEEVGFDPLQTVLSILSVVVGFTVYYLIPYSFTFMNMSLFFGILTGILLGMLFGLAMLAQALQSLLERFITFLMIWGPDRRNLYGMVRKNLSSHSSRNSKTTTMFTICLTFIIFTGCVFKLQGHNIQELVKLGVGSDIAVLSYNSKFPIPEDDIRAFLDNEIVNNSKTTAVDGYSFVTFPLDKVMNIRSTNLNTLAHYPSAPVRIYGVEKNLLQTAFIDFYNVKETNSRLSFPKIGNKPDVVQSLYSNAHRDTIPDDPNGVISPPPSVISNNSQFYNWVGETVIPNDYIYVNYTDMVISNAFRLYVGATTDTPFNIDVEYKKVADGSSATISLLGKPQSMVSMFPAFFFSSYSATVFRSPVLINMEQFNQTLQIIANSTVDGSAIVPNQIPKSKLLVRLKAGTDQSGREFVVNGIKNFIKSNTVQVLDTAFLLETTDTAITLLNIFFYTVSITSIILCFFMLWVSFSSNIHENSWEFGVLRAIGLTAFQVKRIYIYESLVLIFCSVILGLLIGLGVAVTLTLQFDLFTQLPFSFQFPYFWFFGVFGASIIMAIVVSHQASKEYSVRPIASVLKGK
ncbi:hypothetical protein SAMD00019534_043800 [Acytostelium subglobosum LB1]|uniref:hypothetical protein n=1 Tax=Acytostelium subglobosum LB1 TaxID=1410327 RepID=UPI00064517C0|nr:hypothetical protein SAMD00019534_043800 [Acytostelium subglobosum LB1]GAM21205.1 hypothetical protein SAMD00019534_043800 [Acytostelium subglobosum LB1]|eukprot:XP_012756339.1 hypothetical protein SAMD00019534_043800 [Acytostelium subglobosum LB1]